MFPVTVSHIHMPHSAGTKEYSQLLIERSDGRACLIQRWGKVGAYGETKELINEGHSFRREFDAKSREKNARGYKAKDTMLGVRLDTQDGLENLRFRSGLPSVSAWAAGLKTGDAKKFFVELFDAAQGHQSSMTDQSPWSEIMAPVEPPDTSVTTSNELYGAF